MLKRLLTPIFIVGLLATALQAAETKAPPFIKVTKNDKGKVISLDTAIVRYKWTPDPQIASELPGAQIERPKDVTIDLIGVIHIGDRSYYNGLNKLFEGYDALCYELVAKRGTRVPQGGRGDAQHPLAAIQQMAKSFLKLEHQLDIINYQAENFVHADMSPQQMAEAMAKRGDDQFTVALSVLLEVLRKQNMQQHDLQNNPPTAPVSERPEQLTLEDLLDLLFDPAGPKKLKRYLALQFEGTTDSGLGKTVDQLLIKDRNEEAMKVVVEQLKKGHDNIGLFYGAAHMPDFHQRLLKMGFKPVKVGYMTAWDLRVEPAGVEDIMRTLERVQQLQSIFGGDGR